MKSKILIFIKGMVMGLVELIPGVSGGTMALILGIYERLINALSEINMVFFHKILAGRLKEAWYQADLTFLVVLVLGSLVAAISFSSIIIFPLTRGSFTTRVVFSPRQYGLTFYCFM